MEASASAAASATASVSAGAPATESTSLFTREMMRSTHGDVDELASEFSQRVSVDPTAWMPNAQETVVAETEEVVVEPRHRRRRHRRRHRDRRRRTGGDTVVAVEVTPASTDVDVGEVVQAVVVEPPEPARQRRGRRRGPTPAGARKRSAQQEEDAIAEIQSCKRHKVGRRYHRDQQLKLRDIVQDLEDNSGEEFLKDIGSDEREDGWDIDKQIDLDAVENNQRGFFKKFSGFLGALKHHKRKNADDTAAPASHEKLKRHGTAVNNLWRKEHRKIPFMFKSLLGDLLGNKKKKEKKQKADGMFDGEDDNSRNAMSFEFYRAIAWYFLVTGNVFSHPFLLFCWNMMVRNCNCDELNFPHLKWHQDSLTTITENTKTNKDGNRDVEQLVDKHIYANIYMPEICPILGLGFYLIVHPQVGTRTSKKLFPGKDTHIKFNAHIQDALDNPDFKRYLKRRGIPYHKLGGYSTRKGASTYATSGSTAGPNVVVVCQRAGWSMGPTLERYLKNGQAGDQFLGRVVCGLPQLNWKFAALPPHFNARRFGEEGGESDAEYELLSNALKIAFPYHEHWGVTFAPVCMFLLASLVHHYDWVCRKLPGSTATRSS